MTKTKGIKRTPGDGQDRIEWLDESKRLFRVRPLTPDHVRDIRPGHLARIPPRFKGQTNYHGRYYFASLGAHVEHESMNEFTGLMLVDHLHVVTAVAAQPMLLTFANGRNHVPDFLVTLCDGRRLLIDVHESRSTTEADAELFALTREMCARVGWDYEVVDRLDDIFRWNLEWMNRYHHPRYVPAADVRQRILSVAARARTFGELRKALATDRPGEHIPALAHLMWQREVLFDLHAPLEDTSRVWTPHRPDTARRSPRT
ncbi:TnsA-like heteromeric transposase endonuclease subunit [Zhihengliuella sp. ISTPL4]|uniref:TnsA-like heteromeric transposase endonuclease subunit n=1 Tax=Zhihengliuella sp. ISTPL4 TaxID=2058657 RepID=UPI001305123C|nr:TnsA-like heteromeric transposase endonuclease subunit [Zhihengliuella sp. ISTPL4]